MTREALQPDTPAVAETAEYEDPRLRTLEETGIANQYMVDRMRDTAGVQSAPTEQEIVPSAVLVSSRRPSRRGGRSIPEISGRDLALQKDAELLAAEKDRPVAAADSVPKALTFSILEALRKGDRQRHARLLEKLDAHERGEEVDLSDPDDNEVA